MTGESDATSPLVISPNADPLVRDVQNPTGVPVSFIQRMPVTKSVNRVTLGDFANASGCSEPARVAVVVKEHDNDDFYAPGWDLAQSNTTVIARSSDYRSLRGSAAKVSWAIPPITLTVGKAYSFWILTDAEGGCQTVAQTTWAHNATQVNSGVASCYTGPYIGPGGYDGYSPYTQRLYHVNGLSDFDPRCLNTGYAYGPDMPTGWLATELLCYGNCRNLAVRSTPVADPPTADCNMLGPTAQWNATVGADARLWRFDAPNNHYDWNCRWTQYGAPGEQLTDGWYYGLPWTQARNGAPRDVYLKLEQFDYRALLRQFAPHLRYAFQETYFADSPRLITDNFFASGLLQDSNQLKTGDETVIAAAAPGLGPAQLSLEFLGPSYPPGTDPPPGGVAAPSDKIDERNAYQEDADRLRTQSPAVYADKAYARATYAPNGVDGKLWLQYWFFYYYNDQNSIIGEDVHEGDWEMIQIGIDSDLRADSAVYGRHATDDSGRCPWSRVNKEGPGLSNPIVYVADGGHGNYFSPGAWSRFPRPSDVADGQGPPSVPSLEFIGDAALVEANPGWVRWEGNWGGSSVDVRSPGNQGRKWNSPDLLDSETPIRDDCPIALASAKAASARRGLRLPPASVRRSSRLPSNPLRIVRARRRGSGVFVSYGSRRARSTRRVIGAELTVHPARRLGSPRQRIVRLRRGQGTLRIALPFGRGPYTARLSAFLRDGRKTRTDSMRVR